MILSLSGFIYQVQIIYDQYMLGRTVVSLEIGRLPEESPPAVTICYSDLFSMERAAKFHLGFVNVNIRYQDLLRNGTIGEMQKLHQESFRNFTNENLKKNGFDINELFNKMSVKFKDLDGTPLMWFRLSANKLNNTLPGQFEINYGKNYYYYTYISEPLETINMRQTTINSESIDKKNALHFSAMFRKSGKRSSLKLI